MNESRWQKLTSRLTTPNAINKEITNFIEKVSDKQPFFIKVEPELWSRLHSCDMNVKKYIKQVERLHTSKTCSQYNKACESKIYAGSACTARSCTCKSFIVKDKYNAQFCENCGHARSLHTGAS